MSQPSTLHKLAEQATAKLGMLVRYAEFENFDPRDAYELNKLAQLIGEWAKSVDEVITEIAERGEVGARVSDTIISDTLDGELVDELKARADRFERANEDDPFDEPRRERVTIDRTGARLREDM